MNPAYNNQQLNIPFYRVTKVHLLPDAYKGLILYNQPELESIDAFPADINSIAIDGVDTASIQSLPVFNNASELTFLRCPNLEFMEDFSNSVRFYNVSASPLLVPVFNNGITNINYSFMPITAIPVVPNSVTNLIFQQCQNLSDTTAISTLPNLVYLSVAFNPLIHILHIPQSVVTLYLQYCNFNQSELNVLADEFLLGVLPKNIWNSNTQQTGAQPSAPKQALLTANVTSVTF